MSDINNARVVDVAQDRKEETLAEFFKRIPEEQREKIIAVAIDMWEPHINAVEVLPEADSA